MRCVICPLFLGFGFELGRWLLYWEGFWKGTLEEEKRGCRLYLFVWFLVRGTMAFLNRWSRRLECKAGTSVGGV
jgi:hypothetical protein